MSDIPENSMVKSTPPVTGGQAADSLDVEGEKVPRRGSIIDCDVRDLDDLGPLPTVSDCFTNEDKQTQSDKNSHGICSCPCHSSNSNCVYDEKLSESVHFRELLLLHLDMIEEQNAILQMKEKHIHNLRIENEQLNARLNRMGRRVALKTRRQPDEIDGDSAKGKSTISKRSYSFGGMETSIKSKKASGVGSSCISVTSKQVKDSATGYFLSTDVDYLKFNVYSNFEAKVKKQEDSKIAVPTWMEVPVENVPKNHRSRSTDKSCAEGIDEATDDESYHRRHLKMELDEIRRKRWDIQQMRQERINENLRQKQRERDDPNQANNKAKVPDQSIQSLHPSAGNAMVIEVANEIPVFALGSRIPHFEPSEFDLPWFDVAKREVQNRQKKNKATRNQRRKTWYKF